MSTATAEPPASTQAEALVSETNDPKNGAGDPVTFTMSEMLQTATKLAAKDGHGVKKETEKPKEEVKEVEKPKETEKPKEAEKPKEEAKEPEIKHNAGHFKVVTEARDKAAAEAAEWKKKHDELLAQTEPLKASATKLTDYEKELETLRKETETYRAKVREFDIAQDPEFQKTYDAKITSGMEEVLGYLTGSGVDKAEAANLVRAWDLRGISDAASDMDEVSKGLMMSAIRETQRVANDRKAQLTKPEDFAAKRRMEIENQQKQAVQQRQSVADKIMAGLLDATPELKEDAHADFRTKVQAQLGRAARGEMPPHEVLAMVAQAEALQMGLAGQHAALVEMNKENEELKKQLAERDSFIKSSNGTLKSETGAVKGGDDDVPSWKRIKVV